MRISDWSSDVCSSDLPDRPRPGLLLCRRPLAPGLQLGGQHRCDRFADHAQLRYPGPGTVGNARDGAPEVAARQIGRASCRERVCQYVSSSVVAVSLKKKTNTKQTQYEQ